MGSYVIAADGILLAPALFAASIYMTLGRIMTSVNGGKKYSIVPIQWLTKLFVMGDILSFIVQGASLGFTITGHDTWGTVVIELGLAIQVVSFGTFAGTAVVFHWRLRKVMGLRRTSSCIEEVSVNNVEGDRSLTGDGDDSMASLAHLNMLYCVTALIMVRSVFRVVLYAGGQGAYVFSHEWLMYVFDCIPMAIVMVVFFFRYPSELRVVDMYAMQEM